jgi:hypothetical protein
MTRIESQSRDQHEAILIGISQHQESLCQVQREFSRMRQETAESQSKLAEGLQTVRQELESNSELLNSMSSPTLSLQSSAMTLGNIGRQILVFLSTFPAEIRDMLKTIVRSNLQIYSILLSSQTNISANPSLLLKSNIRFEDALGRVRELPFEWFRHWEASTLHP